MSMEKEIDKFRHLIEPFYFEGGEVCIFLVHGYTGTPSELRPLGEFLAAKGFTVTCPLLPGHGTSHKDLANMKWTEWYDFAEQEWLKLRDKYKKVFVVGISLGGAIALQLATKFDVDAVIALASGTRPGDWRLPMLPFFKWIIKSMKKTKNAYARGPERKRFAYEYNPIASTGELVKLYNHLEKNLSSVKAPLLLVHSKDDIIVPYPNTDIILKNVSSSNVKLVSLEKAGHIITLSEDQDTIHKEVLEFIENLT
ncbi:MAG: alpha/beta fold hydrolase [bacterium]|nr:alpha/beta fold hydrolase [bacterium]